MIANPMIQGGGGNTHDLTVGGKQFDFTAGMTWADVAENYPGSFSVSGVEVKYQNSRVFYPGDKTSVKTVELVTNIIYSNPQSGGGMD